MKKNNLFTYRANKYFTTREHPESLKGEIKIVDPKMYPDFIKFVLDCRKNINTLYKLIITLELTLGARVSEILNLTKDNIIFKNGNYFARIKVLKKKKKDKKPKIEWRISPIHPLTVPLLTDWLKSLRSDEKLFNLNRSTVYRKYKHLFDIHPHCLRHSMITYLIEIQGWSMQRIVKHFHFSEVKTALCYFNYDGLEESKQLIDMWDEKEDTPLPLLNT